MKKSLTILVLAIFLAVFVQSCCVFKSKPTVYAIDLVCNMRVDVSEAFLYKYKGKDYYFDSYDCKQSFKMNPDKFINNICVSPADTTGKVMKR